MTQKKNDNKETSTINLAEKKASYEAMGIRVDLLELCGLPMTTSK